MRPPGECRRDGRRTPGRTAAGTTSGTSIIRVPSACAILLWDVATGAEIVASAGHDGPVTALVVVPHGSWLASGGQDGAIRLWDVATMTERAGSLGHDSAGREAAYYDERGAEHLFADHAAVQALAVGPGGSWLASIGKDRTVRIWDVPSGRPKKVMIGHTRPPLTLAVSPDGSWLASAGEDGTVRMWDVESGAQRTIPGGLTSRTALVIAYDGSWLASADWGGIIHIWDAATGEERRILKGHTAKVHKLMVSPDGSRLVSAGHDGALRVWNVSSGSEIASVRVDGLLRTCCWTSDDKVLAGGAGGVYEFELTKDLV